MAEETITDNQESKPDEDVELAPTAEESVENTDVEQLKAELAKANKKAADQEGRANKAEIQLKKAKSPQSELNDSPISDEKYERLDLKTDGYKNEEVDLIMELGGTKVLSNPIVKQAIADLRSKAKSQQATPSGTAKSPVYQKFTEKDLKRMDLAELEKIVPQE